MCFLATARRVIKVERERKPAPAKNRPSCFKDRCDSIDDRGSSGGIVV